MSLQKPLVPFGIFSSDRRLFNKGYSNHGNSARKQNCETGDVYHHVFGLSLLQTFSALCIFPRYFISVKYGEMVLNLSIAIINDLVGYELNG